MLCDHAGENSRRHDAAQQRHRIHEVVVDAVVADHVVEAICAAEQRRENDELLFAPENVFVHLGVHPSEAGLDVPAIRVNGAEETTNRLHHDLRVGTLAINGRIHAATRWPAACATDVRLAREREDLAALLARQNLRHATTPATARRPEVRHRRWGRRRGE